MALSFLIFGTLLARAPADHERRDEHRPIPQHQSVDATQVYPAATCRNADWSTVDSLSQRVPIPHYRGDSTAEGGGGGGGAGKPGTWLPLAYMHCV
jgi:hypothetical protein